MQALEIMTRDPVTVTSDTTLDVAARLMARHRISGLPVVGTDGALVGLITEGDLLRRAELGTERHIPAWRAWLLGAGRLASGYVHAHARRVGDLMTPEVVTVAPSATLEQVVTLMEARSIKRVPVVEQGKLVGIVSRADLLRALQRLLPAAAPADTSDAEIRRQVLAQIDAQSWTPRGCIHVAVAKGVVELSGLILHEQERAALRVLAENVPGVVRVVDHLAWIEPLSGMLLELPPEAAAGAERDREPSNLHG